MKLKMLLCLAIAVIAMPAFSQGLKAFKLKNGLSVYIWEDASKSDVFGLVGVRAGSINEPEEYTGLAHYLEHVMFKGTDNIGALNWTEEEPIYKEIIAKYDQRAADTDPVKKDALNQEINELTLKAGKISLPTEYSSLMESIGAKGVNAATSYDYTFYHSSFPAYQINKWLEISSQRFIHPVFRSFQPELENVYEEYNRAQDNPNQAVSSFFMSKAFEGHPYAAEQAYRILRHLVRTRKHGARAGRQHQRPAGSRPHRRNLRSSGQKADARTQNLHRHEHPGTQAVHRESGLLSAGGHGVQRCTGRTSRRRCTGHRPLSAEQRQPDGCIGQAGIGRRTNQCRSLRTDFP